MRVVSWVMAASLAGIGACGPSVQSIYEGNVRFEHCYRLDLDREIAPSHREACWREWSEIYAYGQTRDRIEYARRRLRYLAAGETSAPSLDLSRAEPAASVSREAAPAPLDVRAPPPTLEKPPAPTAPTAPEAPASARVEPRLPGAPCMEACATSFTTCTEPCRGGAAEAPSRCVGCEGDYGRCVRRCFE
ncbi:MAG TPA: hypothetical protein PLU22_15750 [Polyangiaceae bacterium]|nr:hypothetical protein [Polyangiaceae bacterium]